MSEELSQELIREFVIAAHSDLEKVREMHAVEPRLIDARYEAFDETPLEAASHMGHRPIAEYVMGQGVPTTICTSAMMGRADEVAAFLDADPEAVRATGAHGFSLLFHTALSGNTDIADKLVAGGGGAGDGQALHAAIMGGHAHMVAWLLAQGADMTATNYQDLTALQAARQLERQEIVEMLTAAGATA